MTIGHRRTRLFPRSESGGIRHRVRRRIRERRPPAANPSEAGKHLPSERARVGTPDIQVAAGHGRCIHTPGRMPRCPEETQEASPSGALELRQEAGELLSWHATVKGPREIRAQDTVCSANPDLPYFDRRLIRLFRFVILERPNGQRPRPTARYFMFLLTLRNRLIRSLFFGLRLL